MSGRGPPGADSSTFTAGKVSEGKPMTVNTNTKPTEEKKKEKDTKAMRPLFGNKPAKKGDIF